MSHVRPPALMGEDSVSSAAGIPPATSFMKVANDERSAAAVASYGSITAALGSVCVPNVRSHWTRVVLVQVLSPYSQIPAGTARMNVAAMSIAQSPPDGEVW